MEPKKGMFVPPSTGLELVRGVRGEAWDYIVADRRPGYEYAVTDTRIEPAKGARLVASR